jgi:hypothetical protein
MVVTRGKNFGPEQKVPASRLLSRCGVGALAPVTGPNWREITPWPASFPVIHRQANGWHDWLTAIRLENSP